MPTLTIPFDQGENTAGDEGDLERGELTKSAGVEYRIGNKNLHTIRGRKEFLDTGSAAKVDGIYLAQFDSGQDYLLALSDDILYGGTPGTSATPTTLIGPFKYTDRLIGTSMQDGRSERNYFVTGSDRLQVLENDGTVRNAGLLAPPQAPVATPVKLTGSESSPDISSISSTNWGTGKFNYIFANDYRQSIGRLFPERVENGSTIPSIDVAQIEIGGWAADTSANRQVQISYELNQGFNPNANNGDYLNGLLPTFFGSAATVARNFSVTVVVEVSEDQGVTYTNLATNTMDYSTYGPIDVPLHNITQTPTPIDSDQVRFRITATRNSGTIACNIRISRASILVDGGPSGADIAATLIYAFAEAVDISGSIAHISAPSPGVEVSLDGTDDSVTLNLPSAPVNARATHWVIYRTADEGLYPRDLGRLAIIEVAKDTHTDGFWAFDATTQPPGGPHMLRVTTDPAAEPDLYQVDVEPPLMEYIWPFRASLLGIMTEFPRHLVASYPNKPESWPTINVIEGFSFPKHDRLIAGTQVGDVCLIGATEMMIVLHDVPNTVSGVIDAQQITPLTGQPGLVSHKALCTYSVSGEERAAWVSPTGIHATDGFSAFRLTSDIDWENIFPADPGSGVGGQANLSTAVLRFDEFRDQLVFAYDSNGDGINDRYALIHLSPEHLKQDKRPKITWNHRGSFQDYTCGLVAGVQRCYSAHGSNGKVYRERVGMLDESYAYNSDGDLFVNVKSPKIYNDWDLWAAVRGNLRHTDAGINRTIDVACTSGRDSSDSSSTVTKTVPLNGTKGSDFFIGRGGEWHQFEMTFSGQSDFALRDLRIEAQRMGASGKVVT